MRNRSLFIVLTLTLTLQVKKITSFTLTSTTQAFTRKDVTTKMDSTSTPCCDMSGHPSTLPGDPSLNLVTNVDLGDKKLEIMKGKAIALIVDI